MGPARKDFWSNVPHEQQQHGPKGDCAKPGWGRSMGAVQVRLHREFDYVSSGTIQTLAVVVLRRLFIALKELAEILDEADEYHDGRSRQAIIAITDFILGSWVDPSIRQFVV